MTRTTDNFTLGVPQGYAARRLVPVTTTAGRPTDKSSYWARRCNNYPSQSALLPGGERRRISDLSYLFSTA
ncbi:hypothetical protein BIW11_04812 [Tropilaelaps mercedesae]|uniref:Uncharacterized protein n=1 Tax=Tropilaelaps mercedesae TaxID=418985 RepID=A0A1V9X0W9_9ACAR|nr:hypothetical protein BIW11_04812 [Tropilaelaps mercedesae]